MDVETRPVEVEMSRRPVTGAASRWVSHQWVVSGVREPDGENSQSGSVPENEEGLRVGGLAVSLHKSEAEGYWLNLNSPAPCVFVMWRQETGEMPVPWVVTVSYNEAGRMLDAGEKVENIPMSAPMQAWLQAYTDANYTPEVRKKVKRNDPFKDGAFRREKSQ